MIWCLFSEDYNYDQPPNNLEAWWKEKPSLEFLLSYFNVDLKDSDAVVKIVKIWDSVGVPQKINLTDYRLQRIKEGKVNND